MIRPSETAKNANPAVVLEADVESEEGLLTDALVYVSPSSLVAAANSASLGARAFESRAVTLDAQIGEALRIVWRRTWVVRDSPDVTRTIRGEDAAPMLTTIRRNIDRLSEAERRLLSGYCRGVVRDARHLSRLAVKHPTSANMPIRFHAFLIRKSREFSQ